MIYCPTCEAGCSEKADVCPKCGHPLAAPADDKIISLITLRTSKPYIIATMVLGVLGLAAYVYVNVPRTPGPSLTQHPAQAVAVSESPSLGSLTRLRNLFGEDQGWRFVSEYEAPRNRRTWLFSRPDGYNYLAAGTPSRIDALSMTAIIDPRGSEERTTRALYYPLLMVATLGDLQPLELAEWSSKLARRVIRDRKPDADSRFTPDGCKLWLSAEWKEGFFEWTVSIACDPQ